MKNEEQNIEKQEGNGVLPCVSNSVVNRDVFAIEAMKVFMTHQGTKRITPFNRIKIWLGINGWKQEFHYNFNDIAKKSYEMADEMVKSQS